MSLSSGNFFAVPVNHEDPIFETQITLEQDLRIIKGKRAIPNSSEAPKTDDLSALKNGIEELKKSGLQGVKTLLIKLAKQLIAEFIGDKAKKTPIEQPAIDPLDPKQAFALQMPSQVDYQLISSLADKDKDLDYYEFRSNGSYGLLMPVSDNLFKEIIFTYPNHNYVEHHYPEQGVGKSVYDWRREDGNLHKMRVYYLSTDKLLAEKYAKETTLEEEKQLLLAVDLASSRAGERTRVSLPNLKIDARTAELSMNFIDAWYLPTLTKAGRQIQYNWDALRVIVRQGEKIISRKICWSTKRGRSYIESVKTTFELMEAGGMGEIAPGEYKLDVCIYDEKVFSYPFSVVKIDSTDTLSEPASYFVIKALADDYAQLSFDADAGSHQLRCYYPLKKLLTTHHSVERFTISHRVTKSGKAWPTWEGYVLESDGCADIDVRNTPSWSEDRVMLQLMFGNQADYRGRKPAPNGNYILHIDLDGKEMDQIHFSFKEGELVADKSLPDIALADVDFPKEHLGYLFPLQKA